MHPWNLQTKKTYILRSFNLHCYKNLDYATILWSKNKNLMSSTHTPCLAALWSMSLHPSFAQPPPAECLWSAAEQCDLLPWRRLPWLVLCVWFPAAGFNTQNINTGKTEHDCPAGRCLPRRLGQRPWRWGKRSGQEQSSSHWLHPWTSSRFGCHLGSLASTCPPRRPLHTAKSTEFFFSFFNK